MINVEYILQYDSVRVKTETTKKYNTVPDVDGLAVPCLGRVDHEGSFQHVLSGHQATSTVPSNKVNGASKQGQRCQQARSTVPSSKVNGSIKQGQRYHQARSTVPSSKVNGVIKQGQWYHQARSTVPSTKFNGTIKHGQRCHQASKVNGAIKQARSTVPSSKVNGKGVAR